MHFLQYQTHGFKVSNQCCLNNSVRTLGGHRWWWINPHACQIGGRLHLRLVSSGNRIKLTSERHDSLVDIVLLTQKCDSSFTILLDPRLNSRFKKSCTREAKKQTFIQMCQLMNQRLKTAWPAQSQQHSKAVGQRIFVRGELSYVQGQMADAG